MIEQLDYEAVGLISGLEVHQQLLTKEKLFCRCPSGLYTKTHDGEVLRHMRPTLSELGEYDGTALMEFKTKKEILYLLNRLNVCTYEMDDTPPFLINPEAIDIAIRLCLLMNMDIIDEVHIARKQYLDGSIPTGFQRTAIIGVNGFLPFKGRRLNVTHLSIEEDSCREVQDIGHRIVFRTDRLGVPLTETVTGADLRTPAEVRDAILLIGQVARSTKAVRTGIGAARQDINVSVRGGSRVEIKGVPRAPYAVKLVHNEAIRQINLLRLRDKLRERGLDAPDKIQMNFTDVSNILAGVEIDYMQKALAAGGRIYGACIKGVHDLALHPTQPGVTFLDELSGRIRVIACLDQPPIVIGSNRLPEFPRIHRTVERLRRRLQVTENDDFYLVWGPEADCRTAVEEIRLRFGDATLGVPKETRQSLIGGFTTFERILPGPDRMYPDTDLPPTRIDPERIEAARAQLPTAPWVREARYREWGVPPQTIHYLIRSGVAEIVDEVVEKTGVDGLLAAVEIGDRAKALGRDGVPVRNLPPERWVEIFDLYTDGRIGVESIRTLAARLAREGEMSVTEACAAEGIDPASEEQWHSAVDSLLTRMADVVEAGVDEKALRYISGQAVYILHGKAAAKDVVTYIKERLEEGNL
ncbi:MAG TPA: Glu-tRNA(Gln) amidotransferase subunit GatE [bacterium]|nr:Glu-tRNA(Gln) amidotransferase subunit GatE [bacterium]